MTKSDMLKPIRNSVIILLSLIGIGIVIHRVVVLVPTLVNGYQPPAISSDSAVPFTQTDDIFARSAVLTLIHILPGLFFVVLGPFQFSPKFRKHNLARHRRNGRIFLISGAIIGVTALVMSLAMPAIGGFNQAAATTLFSLFFLVALWQAYRTVRQRKIALHREWMIRAYFIGLAVATIRLLVVGLFATTRLMGSTLTLPEIFGTGFWIGFVLHLMAAEIWIARTRVNT